MNSNISILNSIRLKAHLFASQNMQQGLQILQMPVVELSTWIEASLLQNPLLERIEDFSDSKEEILIEKQEQELDFEKSSFDVLESLDPSFSEEIFPETFQPSQESLVSHPKSLFGHLKEQIDQTFSEEEKVIAELLLEHMDTKGFLQIEEESEELLSFPPAQVQNVLRKMQQLDPPGIAARNLQESFLLQLERKNLSSSLAYKIIQDHFSDFLAQRFFSIQRALQCSEEAFSYAVYTQIKCLDSSPGACFSSFLSPSLIPDVFVTKVKDSWKVVVNSEILPKFRICEAYSFLTSSDSLSKEEKREVKKHLFAGRWLEKMLVQRAHTLEKITLFLLKNQKNFFENHEPISPLSVKEAAKEVGIHESNVARAIKDKYLSCPWGTFPFREFFSFAVRTSSGKKISTETAKAKILRILEQENKESPLSDKALSEKLRLEGIVCARRTIAKYRNQLKKPKASERKCYRSSL